MKNHFFILAALSLLAVACHESTEEPNPVVTGNVPTVRTDSLVENLGVSAIFAGYVQKNGGNALYDNGFIVDTTPDLTMQTSGVALGGVRNPKLGSYETTVAGLQTSTNYYYRAFSMNAKGVSYGDVKSFRTLDAALFKSPYNTDFSPARKEITRTGWALDTFSGYGDYDYVFWFDLENELGMSGSGWAIVAYYNDTLMTRPLKISSPLIRIAENDNLYFYFIPMLFGSREFAIDIYVTEDLDDLGAPLSTFTDADVSLRNYSFYQPLNGLEGKECYVVYVLRKGDITLYHFGISNRDSYPDAPSNYIRNYTPISLPFTFPFRR